MKPGIDLALLTVEHFQPLLGQAFVVHLPEGQRLRLELGQAEPHGNRPSAGMRAPFSLIFRCEQLPRDAYLRQGCYPIEHPELGTLELFITPILPDGSGMRYQAVFG